MNKQNHEYEKFDRTMQELIRVPHSEIKGKLEAEKAAKKPKQKEKRNDNRNKDNHPVK